jgi:predicted nucleotidyltransferase
MRNRHLDWLRQSEADLASARTSLEGSHFEWACRRRTPPVNVHDESSTSARVRYAEPERIRKAVHDYAREIRGTHPEVRSIRWFGSWVRGDAGVGSDVDLCIIVDHSDGPRRDRIMDFLPRVFPVGIDLFIYTAAEFTTLLTEHPAMREAIDAGLEV